MNMRGMSMGGAGGSGPGATMGHFAANSPLNLLPAWLGVAAVAMFVLIAGSHLRHLASTSGERRWWHVCHVLMAVGMVFMYLPAALDPFGIAAQSWQFLFSGVAVVVGARVVAGVTGRASDSPLWSLTAIALGTMIYMWSSGPFLPALTWVLVVYLFAEAGLWGVNAYRTVDGGLPLIGWAGLVPATEGGQVVVSGGRTEALMSGVDISVSMTAMALGMAYMLAAMQLMR